MKLVQRTCNLAQVVPLAPDGRTRLHSPTCRSDHSSAEVNSWLFLTTYEVYIDAYFIDYNCQQRRHVAVSQELYPTLAGAIGELT